VNFLFELGQLRRIKHEGWKIIGVKDPESVAEHSLRAAQLGYILAGMEKYKSPEKVASMLVFHDIGECRIGDIHKIANRYVKADEAGAVEDQTEELGKIGKEIKSLWGEAEYCKTVAGQIAKDADYLEQAVTAREYIVQGYDGAQDWLNNIAKKIKTASAKKLLKEISKANPNEWWKGLKKLS